MRGNMCDPIVKYLLFLSSSNQNWNMMIYFSKILQIQHQMTDFFLIARSIQKNLSIRKDVELIPCFYDYKAYPIS